MFILNKKKCLPHLKIAKVEEGRKVMKESCYLNFTFGHLLYNRDVYSKCDTVIEKKDYDLS